MKLNLIMYENSVIGAFTSPTFTDIEPDAAAEQIERSIKLQAEAGQFDKVKPYRNLKMKFMGTFDDETGNFNLLKNPRLLLDCGELVRPLLDQHYSDLSVKEGDTDGSN